ncbi:uncharacterized protein LOC131693075 [Topomyia yanbarensis]|uniref:uncharacterized protein LOC131693075 n=1 Tax=Topomyia yanbarensis TaxID=2498891 RepID=UPI00273B2B7B|nr:uncharacterized protein LOC131693075 [Topomyia yanbarensis]
MFTGKKTNDEYNFPLLAKVTCVQCSTKTEGDNCAKGSLTPQECTTDDDKCYERIHEDHVVRGCLSDLSPEHQSKCNDPTDFSCATCIGSNCNVDNWRKCYHCDGTSAACIDAQKEDNTAKYCATFVKNDACYSKVEGDKVIRGCRSDLANPVTSCDNVKYCEMCEGDVCNKESSVVLKDLTKCLRCTSANEKCTDASFEATDCPLRIDSCYSRVQGDVLQRGCLSQLPEADQKKCTDSTDTSCVSCEGSGCNTILYLHCYQCQETTDPNCALQQTAAAPFCQTYKVENRCYERLESSKIVRGCENDLGAAVDACKDNEKCRTCSTNGCNKEVASSLDSIDRCLQCSTGGDPQGTCLAGTAASQPCAKASSGKCYSMIDANGALKRGCQGDLTAEEVKACTGKTCNICEAAGCNKGNFPEDRLKCYQCTSTDADKSCSDQLTGEPKAAYCKKYKDGDKCYSRISNGIFERGCESDLAKTACDGLKDTECQLCSGENCNALSEEKLKNSAGVFSISSMLVALSTLVLALNAFR